MSVKNTITYIVIFIKINDVVKNPDEIDFRLVQAITSIFSVMAMKQRGVWFGKSYPPRWKSMWIKCAINFNFCRGIYFAIIIIQVCNML